MNKCRKTEAEAEVEAAEDMMSTMSSNPNSPTSPRESQIGDDAYREKLLNEYLTSVGRLHCILNKLVKEYADVRMNFVWHKLSHPNINSNEQSNSGEESSKYSYNIRYDSKLFSSASNNEYHIQPDDSDARIFISLEKHLQSIMQLHNIPVEGNLHLEEDIGKVISSETEHLSIKNVSYRSAYISRLIFVGNLVSNLDGMFQAKYVKLSYQTAIVKEYFRFQKYITTFFDFKVDIAFLETLIQPAKIAGAVTITAIFVVYPGVLGVDIQDALWPGITLCFIRQENSASSFLTSYQRLEGTVIGSFYVLFVYVILSNSTLTDDYGTSQFYLAYTGPLIVVWVSVCCYFREGPVHGFAAVTAAITPIVLLLGPFANNVTTLLFRYVEFKVNEIMTLYSYQTKNASFFIKKYFC